MDKLKELSEKSTVTRLPANSAIFRQGEQDKRTIFLVSGEAELSISWQAQKNIVKANTLEAKQPLSPQTPRICTAKAKTAVEILTIDSDLLEVLLGDDLLSGAGYSVTELNIQNDDESDWMLKFLSSEAFLRIPANSIQSLILNLVEEPVKKGDVIFKSGEINNQYYIIKQGQCAIFSTSAVDKVEKPIAIYSDGEGFGEEALITNQPSVLTAKMKTDGALMKVSKDDFLNVILKPIINWISIDDAINKAKKGAYLIDVRQPDAFMNGHIEGALNFGIDKFRANNDIYKSNRDKIIYCSDGTLSQVAAFLSAINKSPCFVIEGGYQTYLNSSHSKTVSKNPYQIQGDDIFGIAEPVNETSVEFNFTEATNNVKNQILNIQNNREETLKAQENAKREIEKLNTPAAVLGNEELKKAAKALAEIEKREAEYIENAKKADKKVKEQENEVKILKDKSAKAHEDLVSAFADMLSEDQVARLIGANTAEQINDLSNEDLERSVLLVSEIPEAKLSGETSQFRATILEKERELAETNKKLEDAAKKLAKEQSLAEKLRKEKEKAQEDAKKYESVVASIKKEAAEQIKRYKALNAIHEQRKVEFENQVKKAVNEAKALAKKQIENINKETEKKLNELQSKLKNVQDSSQKQVEAARLEERQRTEKEFEKKQNLLDKTYQEEIEHAKLLAQEEGLNTAKSQAKILNRETYNIAREIIEKSNSEAEKTIKAVEELKNTTLIEVQELYSDLEDTKRKIEEEAEKQRNRVYKELEKTRNEADEIKKLARKEVLKLRASAEREAERTKQLAVQEAENIRKDALFDKESLQELFAVLRKEKSNEHVVSAQNENILINTPSIRKTSSHNNVADNFGVSQQESYYQHYEPIKKRGSKVKLFIGIALCAYAGYYYYVYDYNKNHNHPVQSGTPYYIQNKQADTSYQQLEQTVRDDALRDFERQKQK